MTDLSAGFNHPDPENSNRIVRIVDRDGTEYFAVYVNTLVLKQAGYFALCQGWNARRTRAKAVEGAASSSGPKRPREDEPGCDHMCDHMEIVETVTCRKDAEAVWNVLSFLYVSDLWDMAVCPRQRMGVDVRSSAVGICGLLRMWRVADRMQLHEGKMAVLRAAIERTVAKENFLWTLNFGALAMWIELPQLALDQGSKAAAAARYSLAGVLGLKPLPENTWPDPGWTQGTMLRLFGDVPATLGSDGLLWMLAAMPCSAMLELVRSEKLRVHSENCVAMLVATWADVKIRFEDEDADGARTDLFDPKEMQLLLDEVKIGEMSVSYLAHRWLGQFRWVRACEKASSAYRSVTEALLGRLAPRDGAGVETAPSRDVVPQLVRKEWAVGLRQLGRRTTATIDLRERVYANGAWFGLQLSLQPSADDAAAFTLGVKLCMFREDGRYRKDGRMYDTESTGLGAMGRVSAKLLLYDAPHGAFVEVHRFTDQVIDGKPTGTSDALGAAGTPRTAPSFLQLARPLLDSKRVLIVCVEDLCFQ